MKIKKTIIIMLTVLTFIACANPVQAISVDETPADNVGKHLIYNRVNYIGGGSAPYSENGVTYYNSGNILELTVTMPANTYAYGVSEVISFDQSQLDLISSYQEIRSTFDTRFRADGWDIFVTSLSGNANQISLSATPMVSADWMSANVSGGALAKVRFRVKDATSTVNGSSVNLNFTNYQMMGYINRQKAWFHKGYVAGNPATELVNLPTISLPSHKTPTPPGVKPPGEVLPGEEFKPDIVINKEITKELGAEKMKEIAEVLASRSYSFSLLGEKVNGLNTFESIVERIINEKKGAKKSTDKYKRYSFNNPKTTKAPQTSDSSEYCYTHFIFLGLSLLLVIGSIGYTRIQNDKLKRKWEVSQ